MGAHLPTWLGYVVGGTIFCLAGLTLGAIVLYAIWEDRRPEDPPDDRH